MATNRPFPSSPGPLFQNEGRGSAFDMEIIFLSHENKTHFQLFIENEQLRLLIVLGLPYILTVIYVFNKRFYYKADTSFSLSFCGKCVAAILAFLKD